MRHVYEVFGIPRVLLSDHDPKFASDLFKRIHEQMGIDQRLGTPYHYRSSGGVEIRVKTLQDELNILTSTRGGRGKDWYDHLPRALSIVNNKQFSKDNPDGLSPASVLFGYTPTSPIDLLAGPASYDDDEEDAVESYLQRRDASRQRFAEQRKLERAQQELRSRVTSAKLPEYEVGHWVVLHKRAFGEHVQRGLNKLESKEAFGPYRILHVDFRKGRLRVELKDEFTKGKSNEFSMEHVRRHWKQRPFKYDALALDDRLDPSALDPEKEWEVDSVSSRRYLHRKYKYAVSYKGADEESKLLPQDHPDFKGCQKMIAEFDKKHPRGSLPFDKPEDHRKWDASSRQRKSHRVTRRKT